jgi:hypothetical protein
MKTIIAGSRNIEEFEDIMSAVDESGFDITEVVSGTAKGVDTLGEAWASFHSIPIKRFRPQWNKYGRGAGIVRNGQMARYADALIAIWDGKSPGTKNMIDKATKEGLKVYVKKMFVDL